MKILIQRDNIKNEETIAHEGSHAADRQAFADSIRVDGSMNNSLNITLRQSEIDAFHVSIYYSLAGNKAISLGYCGIDPCRFTANQTPVARDNLINDLLNDPKNPYAKMDLNQVLYPVLLKPQQK